MRTRLINYSLITTISTLLLINTAFAGAFQLWPQSAKMVGNYAAGAAASANDPSTAYYNPAGLTRIRHQDIAISALAQITNVKIKGQSTINNVNDFVDNNGITQGGTASYIPTILYAAPISDKWGFGFSMTSPFNSELNYGKNAFTRYALIKSIIHTLDFGLALAYRPFKPISLGFGVDAQRFRGSFDQFDTQTTVANTSTSKNETNDWAYGWNAGLLWEFNPTTRVGLSYRAKIKHHSAGNSKFYGPLTSNNVNRSRVKTNITVPPMTILSIYHEFNDKFALMGTINYIQWREFKSFSLRDVATMGSPNTVTFYEDFRNTWRLIIGADYKVNSLFTLRGALGYDQTPTRNYARSVGIPDANSYIVALGVTYALTDTMSIDAGYSHSFYQHVSINRTQNYGLDNVTTIANVDNSMDIFGLEFNWQMT